jgi:hypothetical protein
MLKKGYRRRSLKASAEVSKWTYLCEILSVRILEYADLMNRKFVYEEFFDKIESTLSEPLKLACIRKSKEKAKNIFLKENDYEKHERFLEDYFITISDLILFFFIERILCQYSSVKKELELKYKRICEWFMRMKQNSKVKNLFIADSASCNDLVFEESNPSMIQEQNDMKNSQKDDLIENLIKK